MSGDATARERLGVHVLAEFFGVDPDRLRDGDALLRELVGALAAHGFQIVCESNAHQFEGGGRGVTGFVLLAQSHAAFHSYPEYGYLALDVYSCGTHEPWAAVDQFAGFVEAARVQRVVWRRGPRLSAAGPADAPLEREA